MLNNNQKEDEDCTTLDRSMAEKIHGRLLLMIKEIHRVCEENNITYYMITGTALGARRHKGFIPWDDDLDICMPRPDYERFSALPQSAFPEFLELRWYKNTENSPFQFIKLIDNRTTLIEELYRDYIEGLYIDIFPLDGVRPDSFFEKMRWEKIWLLHKLVILKRSTIQPHRLTRRIELKLIKMLNLNSLHKRLEKELHKVSFEESDRVANFLGAWGKREIVDKIFFGEPKLYMFEDTELYGPENIDAYLTNVYGDFMTPPPPEKCVFRHNYPLLDLNTPFRSHI